MNGRASDHSLLPMRTCLLPLTLALAACDGVQSSARGDTAARDTLPPAPVTAAERPDSSAAREIYIDSTVAANPVVVFGRARTFENTVQVRVRDAAGTLLSEVHTTSAGEMGHHNPFSARVWLTRPPGARIIVEAFEYSAKDGSERSLIADTVAYAVASAPLTLAFPVGDCGTTATFTRAAPRTVAVARLMTEALVAGPDSTERAAGASMPFPEGAAVNSVVLRGTTITVDFNERLQNVGGACAAQGIRAAVTSTLLTLGAVRMVVITAGGRDDVALQP